MSTPASAPITVTVFPDPTVDAVSNDTRTVGWHRRPATRRTLATRPLLGLQRENPVCSALDLDSSALGFTGQLCG